MFLVDNRRDIAVRVDGVEVDTRGREVGLKNDYAQWLATLCSASSFTLATKAEIKLAAPQDVAV
jgi:hypothetical protein